MAKLIVPTVAYAWKGDHTNSRGRLVMNTKPGKFHLIETRLGNTIATVCNYILVVGDPRMVIKPIDQLEAKDLCKTCLAAMKAED